VVINDILDTDADYIRHLKDHDLTVINIEDLGSGAKIADVVINAMYEKRASPDNQYFGYEYFILKQEFLHCAEYSLRSDVKNVLITFGGVDPCNLTKKVLEAIHEYAIHHQINIVVVAGMGYKEYESIEGFENIEIVQNIKNISEYMLKADIAFCSGGRTTFELAAIGVPTIVLCQNERELTHGFCKNDNGFVNLGLGETADLEQIKKAYLQLINDDQLRKKMNEKYVSFDLKRGKDKVMGLVQEVVVLNK
jgi:spore coat polysaccharide biosynthesis predicted glycosyltransferase SpsG